MQTFWYWLTRMSWNKGIKPSVVVVVLEIQLHKGTGTCTMVFDNTDIQKF